MGDSKATSGHAAHGNADGGGSQGRRVVYPVPHHGDWPALIHQPAKFEHFLIRHKLRANVVGSDCRGDGPSHVGVVAGQNRPAVHP